MLRKQRLHIEKLGKENAQLKQELSLETRAVATGGSAVRLSSQINKLTEAGDGYARRIELERQRTIQLDKQLKTMQDDLLKARVAMGGIHAPAESDYAVEKTVRILENRLDKALVKFNEAIAVNKELRNTIDNLRRERLSFDALYKKLQRELAEKKRSMAEIIEQANVAYEERDRLQAEAAKARAASDAEAVAFEKEWKELGDVLDQDLKAHEAMSRELAKRAEAVAVAEGDARGSLTIAEEQALRRQSRAQAWGLAKDRTVVQTAAERAAAFEAAFAQIEARTGVTDISELVDRFVAAEEENFARFNQLNELLVEVEKAEEAVAEARAEVERARGNERGADSQRRRHAAELEAKVRARAPVGSPAALGTAARCAGRGEPPPPFGGCRAQTPRRAAPRCAGLSRRRRRTTSALAARPRLHHPRPLPPLRSRRPRRRPRATTRSGPRPASSSASWARPWRARVCASDATSPF